MIDPVRLALVGCGRIAQIAHLPALEKAEGIELVAVSDPSEEVVRAVARRYGLSAAHTDQASVWDDESVEAATLDRLPCAVLRLSGTEVLDLSHEACRELGRGRDELIGDGFLRSLVDADREALRAAVAVLAVVPGAGVPDAGLFGEDASDDGAPATVLEVRRPLDEATVEVFELGLALDDDDGSVLVDVRDATERYRLDRELDRLGPSTRIVDARSNLLWPPAAEPYLMDDDADLLQHPGETRVRFSRRRLDGPGSPLVETRTTAVNRLDDPRIAGIVVRSERATTRSATEPAPGS